MLGIAAVIGREFDLELVIAAGGDASAQGTEQSAEFTDAELGSATHAAVFYRDDAGNWGLVRDVELPDRDDPYMQPCSNLIAGTQEHPDEHLIAVPLLASEELALASVYSVRGYPERSVLASRGAWAYRVVKPGGRMAAAVWGGHRVRIRYRRWEAPREVVRTLEPLGLALAGVSVAGLAYLIGQSRRAIHVVEEARHVTFARDELEKALRDFIFTGGAGRLRPSPPAPTRRHARSRNPRAPLHEPIRGRPPDPRAVPRQRPRHPRHADHAAEPIRGPRVPRRCRVAALARRASRGRAGGHGAGRVRQRARQADDAFAEWLFERNPHRDPEGPAIWLCVRDGKVVGQVASVTSDLYVGDTRRRGGWRDRLERAAAMVPPELSSTTRVGSRPRTSGTSASLVAARSRRCPPRSR